MQVWDTLIMLSTQHARDQWAQLSDVTQLDLWTKAEGHLPRPSRFGDDSKLKMPDKHFDKPDGWTYVDDQVPLMCGIRID